MTDTLQPNERENSLDNINSTKPSAVDTTMQLFERIADKQTQIYKLKEHISFFRSLIRKIGGTISLFAGMNDAKYRENQFYNVLNCYICGDIVGAKDYQSKAVGKPEGLWQKLRYGLRLRKARKQLRALLFFIDKSGCRQKFLDYESNPDYCTCMKLVLSERQQNQTTDEFLERRVLHEKRYLSNLKILQQKRETNLSAGEAQRVDVLMSWIDNDKIIENESAGWRVDKLNQNEM